MSGNTFGLLYCVTSFGESHGPAYGGVVDGCPPGLALAEGDIQKELDRRKPGSSRHVTQRQESDRIELLSGIFEGRTTGTAIGFLVRNEDQRSKDYAAIAQKFRPGHADYTYFQKYGVRDPRGGGRASARETVVRVAAGAIAKKWLRERYGVRIRGYLAELGVNKNGGLVGGSSTGQDITLSIALKPTSSIRLPRRTIDSLGQPVIVETTGRHDPCVGIRATPIAEAMLACVLMDHALRHRAQCADVILPTKLEKPRKIN